MLSTLQLFTFLVPAPAGEKISLSITVLLSFVVFLMMVSETMPQTSTSVPLLGKTLTLVTQNIAHRNSGNIIKNENGHRNIFGSPK